MSEVDEIVDVIEQDIWDWLGQWARKTRLSRSISKEYEIVEVLEYSQVFSNDAPGLTLTYFTAWSNLVRYAFVWEKLKQWFFQKLL